MRAWLACPVAALCLLPFILSAGEPPVSYSKFCVTCGILGADTIASMSGQFVVHGSTVTPPRVPERGLTNSANFLVLNPQTVAITSERVKVALADELVGLTFSQKVHVVLMPLASPLQSVTVVSRVYRDGVVFQLGMPARIEPDRFIKALVQVLLADFTSSRSGRVPELPAWVVEGMTQRLFARVAPTLVANRRPLTYEITGYDRLHAAREVLSTNACLTFHELSFPKASMSRSEADVYQASAHLFVAELLKLPNGPRLFTRFLATLPGALNWQTSFYAVYGDHFQTALDIEKWWALSWLDFKMRQDQQEWPLALSLQKLAGVLVSTMQIRTGPDSLPLRRDVPLQEFITRQEFDATKEVIQDKLQQMFFLQFNMPESSRKVLAEYHAVLEDYLQKRSGVRATVRKLDELDRQRESLRLMAGQ